MKGKEVPVHFTQAYRGNRGLVSLILNLGTKWRRVVKNTPQSLYHRVKPALKKKAEWVPGPVWPLQRKGTSLAPLWKSNQEPTVYSHQNE